MIVTKIQLPGKIVAHEAEPDGKLKKVEVHYGSRAGVDLSIFQKRSEPGIFGGEGFIMQKLRRGMRREFDGRVVEDELQPGQ